MIKWLDDGVVTSERGYFLTSPAGIAAAPPPAVRGRRAITNRRHWALDPTFQEDENRPPRRHAVENLAVVRHTALNLLCQDR